jgi:hypothetical protein
MEMDSGSEALGLLFIGGLIHLCLCAWVGTAAQNKGRSAPAFFFIALLLSPVIGGIIVACLSRDESVLRGRQR